ncbi:hypothetical protein SALBM217S_03516 [Streptomyces griseoloalbus]
MTTFNDHPEKALRVHDLHQHLGLPTDEPSINVTRSRLGRLLHQGLRTTRTRPLKRTQRPLGGLLAFSDPLRWHAAARFGTLPDDGLVHTARLPLLSAPLNWLADLIRGHLRKIGSRWRAPPAGRNATIVLAALRCDQRPGDLAGGNGIHRTTVTRWAWRPSACRPPAFRVWGRALKKIARTGGGVVLLDGSAIRTRRRTGKENRRNCSGKNKCHGLLVIALTDERVGCCGSR